MKMLESVTDGFEDVVVISRGFYVKAACECGWSADRYTVWEAEVEKCFTIGLRHSRVTGHRIEIRQSVEWQVDRIEL